MKTVLYGAAAAALASIAAFFGVLAWGGSPDAGADRRGGRRHALQ